MKARADSLEHERARVCDALRVDQRGAKIIDRAAEGEQQQPGGNNGASDAQAAYVKDKPVSTADICATIYQCLGIDPDMPVHDRSGRPVPIAHGGQPVRDILA